MFGSKNYWAGYDDGYEYTAPVDTFAPSEAGIHAFSGNVYEWCWDWYSTEDYNNSPVDNPASPETGEMQACRDGGFRMSDLPGGRDLAGEGLSLPRLQLGRVPDREEYSTKRIRLLVISMK